MRTLLVGLLLGWRALSAQVQPPVTFTDSSTLVADPQPDADGLYKPGGAVTLPKLIRDKIPEYSKVARAKRIEGEVLVSLIVDENGKPKDVHVIRSVGYGLDEAAVKAVSAYRFRPSQLKNKPVPIRMNVAVNFQLS